MTEVHDTTEPQESDAHDIAVPLPVSNYRLPDARVLQRGTRPEGKDVDVERVGASLLAALDRARRRGAADRHRLGPARHALRAAARARHEGLARLRAARRPRLRARDDRDPHPRADPRQAGRRRRGAQPLAEPRLARRSRRRAGRRLAAHRLARQGHLRPHGRGGPRPHAPPADRRHDRLRQVRLHQLDALLDPAARDAGRGADDPDRPEEGRAQPLRDDSAPAHAGRHEHEERRRRARERGARDGVALRADGPAQGAQPARDESRRACATARRRCPTCWS